MFDESSVVRLNFRADGTQINREPADDRVEECRELRRTALAHAVPFADYVAARE